jgi:16S rRNA (uracil1498-N3)-methyltransferase
VVGIDRKGLAAGCPNFVTTESFAVGTTCVLDDHATRHMRVLRLEAGARVGIRDGHGHVGVGQLVRLTKTQAFIDVSETERVMPLPAVHLLVPVADRDRMLWLAEKACELGCTSWRPVLWRRSRSVSPRGEGIAFQHKVMARMVGALAQSEGAWLPQPFPEATLDRALLAAPPGDRMVLDPGGEPVIGTDSLALAAPIILAVGPEGGIESDELDALVGAGFRTVRLGPTILRFETAAIAALGVARTVLGGAGPGPTLPDSLGAS